MSKVTSLYRLQKIDSQIDPKLARVIEIDHALNEDQKILAAQGQLKKLEQGLHLSRNSVKKAEEMVMAQRVKIEQSETSLYAGTIRSPKELQDLQNEIVSLKRRMVTLEDQQLEAMLEVETEEDLVEKAAKHLTEVEQDRKSAHLQLISEKDALLKDIARLEEERNATSSLTSAIDMEIYEKLRGQKRGIAVAEVIDYSCSACGAPLTPGEWQTARVPNQISFCLACGRILYAG